MKLLIQKLSDNAVIPARATSGSAGYDLSACLDAPLTVKQGRPSRSPPASQPPSRGRKAACC